MTMSLRMKLKSPESPGEGLQVMNLAHRLQTFSWDFFLVGRGGYVEGCFHGGIVHGGREFFM